MGLIFNKETEKNKEVFDLLCDIDCIVDELMFREDLGQSCYPYYKDAEWDKLCDEAITKFDAIKKEQTDLVVNKRPTAHWREEFDDTINTLLYICSECGATYVGLPRTMTCPVCLSFIVDAPEGKECAITLDK